MLILYPAVGNTSFTSTPLPLLLPLPFPLRVACCWVSEDRRIRDKIYVEDRWYVRLLPTISAGLGAAERVRDHHVETTRCQS